MTLKVKVRTGIGEFLPKTEREQKLAEFWYHKGRAEAELESSPAFKRSLKRKVEIQVK